MPRAIGNGAHRFDAVLDQIDQHLLQLHAVAQHQRKIVAELRRSA